MTRFLRPVPGSIFVGADGWREVQIVAIGNGPQPGLMRVETVSDGAWNVDAKGLRCEHEAARKLAAEALGAKIRANVTDRFNAIFEETARLVREMAPGMEPDVRERAEAMADGIEGKKDE